MRLLGGARSAGDERYTLGYGERVAPLLAGRTAEAVAGHLVPHLRPGMRLLDCGCGPGSITLDLAEVIAPEMAFGVDREPSQIALAHALAARRGMANARFGAADVYELPFPDASFDAAFANT